MLHLQKPRLGSRKRETHDRPNYPVRRSPTTAAHTLPQRGSNPGQVTYRIAPTNTNEPNSTETEPSFPLYFLPSSEKYFFLDHALVTFSTIEIWSNHIRNNFFGSEPS